jgi:cellulose biosynthesis protein BcsQ
VEARRRQEELDLAHRELERVKEGVDKEKSKLEQLLITLRDNETGIWTTFPRDPPITNFDSRMGERRPLVLTVANNKGGVGKTTLVGNLIAHFDVNRRLKVLSIDLDYQGSLSTMLRNEFGDVAERRSAVNGLLERGASIGTVYEATRRLGRRLNLALFEDRLLVEWLLQAGGDDVRYRLANVLHSSAMKDKFDIVIIDVPPRLTTGTINALCASTHVLVPTIFNPIAAEPVSNFLAASTLLMHKLNPTLDFIGVVETMAPRKGEGEKARSEGRRLIQEALDQSFPTIRILNSYVPRRTAMSDGGIAYLDNREARAIFDELGREIGKRMGLK